MQRKRFDRRSFMKGAVAGASGAVLASSRVARAAVPSVLGGDTDPIDIYKSTASRLGGARGASSAPLYVYVLVTDGLRADEVTPILMPRLSALRDTGTSFVSAQAMHIAETLPNHVAMMTGVTAARNGVPGNSIYDRDEEIHRRVDRGVNDPGGPDIAVPTLFETLGACGLTTACVQSKQYLYTIFSGRADHEWQPTPQIPASDHSPDNFTMDATLGILETADPQFMFVNLGDIDRSGHVDVSGSTILPGFRTSVLAHTDLRIGRFLDVLLESGRWERSAVVVVADHSMDWSLPNRYVNLSGAMDADDEVRGRYQVGQNGGADLLYYTGDPEARDFVVGRMRDAALAQEGVLSAHDPAELQLGSTHRAGDLVVFVKPGWRMSDPAALSNPIPGNHGHPKTLPIPFFIGGGHPVVRQSWVEQTVARNIDVAPTVGWLVGLDAAPVELGEDGYDGAVRLEAFDPSLRPASVCT